MTGEVIDGEAVEELDNLPAVREVAPLNLFRTDDPNEVIARATETATALADVLKKQKLTSTISGREHVKVEGWTLLGTMLGVFPVCTWTRKLDNGWEARVEARTLSGAVVGAAEAECLTSEKTWAKRDDYALRSMAQTRATSKALRQPLGFVVSLAGFEVTPAEEMDFPGDEPRKPAAADKPASWEDIKVLLSTYDEGKTYELFTRFGASARKLLYGEEDLSKEQKGELFTITAAAAVKLTQDFDPGKFPPPTEEDIARAWAGQLEGVALQPAPQEGGES